MMDIPAPHDAASDRPLSYTPVCDGGAIQVCLNPAYRAYLPDMTAALSPLLSQLAGLPGVPDRVTQAAPVSHELPGGQGSFRASAAAGRGPLTTPVNQLLRGSRWRLRSVGGDRDAPPGVRFTC